jgi:hypothetical protein
LTDYIFFGFLIAMMNEAAAACGCANHTKRFAKPQAALFWMMGGFE